ncbi:winged helix-turn-helix domain-containing protein [Cupriavidus plantarum]|uniref:winged helix-turn-helix domain-containing protein n=1 Tax=Cupriavidus plantarum TaxID=942865 RepID=UPI00339D760E
MSAVYVFDEFQLIPGRQLLLRAGEPVKVGGRAFLILVALVQRPGELVSAADLLKEVWQATVVEPSNLKVHVAALRRALGDQNNEQRLIATIVGRGYRFVAPVLQYEQSASPPRANSSIRPRIVDPVTMFEISI